MTGLEVIDGSSVELSEYLRVHQKDIDTEYFAWCPLCNDAMTHKLGGKNEDNVYYCEGCEKHFKFIQCRIGQLNEKENK